VNMKPYLSLATSSWDKSEVEAIYSVIASDMYTMGEKVREYEKCFADYIGSKFAIMSNSGSSANLLMIASLFYHSSYKLSPEDEVIVPSVSWGTTYFPLQQYGLKVKFVDIDSDTLNIDITSLDSALTPRTKALFAVNLLGNPNNFDVLSSFCEKNSLILIEDNCESLGAEFKGKKAGTFGLMGSFSSFFSHHISTMEGGITVTDDEELYHIMLSLRAHGWTRNLPIKNRICQLSDDRFTESFRFILPGYNLRPLEMSGAIGIEQLKKLPSLISARQKNAEFFTKLFSQSSKILIQKEIGASSWFGFSLILSHSYQGMRPKLQSILDHLNVEYRPIVTGNFAKSEVLKYFNYEISGPLDNASYLDSNGLFIGNHHYDITAQLSKIFYSIEDIL
jgi:CDP-6-deoxy-D-xylo-4-hexulose-3-dehydrase